MIMQKSYCGVRFGGSRAGVSGRAAMLSAQRSRGASRTQVKPMAVGPPPEQKTNSTGSGGGLTRDQEPDQYWSSPLDKPGANPMKDPVAIIGVVSILFPFIFVLIAIGTGAIDTSVYR